MKIVKSISSHAALFIHPLLWVLSKIVSFLKPEELFIYFFYFHHTNIAGFSGLRFLHPFSYVFFFTISSTFFPKPVEV